MAKTHLVVGLDVGTYLTKIAVAKQLRPDKEPSVIALGTTLSEGLRRGVVVDIHDATRSIVVALEQASKMIEEDISQVIVSINGEHLGCMNTAGKVAVSRADGEVTQEDLERVIANATPDPSSANKSVIDVVPKNFILDEESGIKNPIGMNGIRLEVEALLLEGGTSAMKNTDKCVEGAKLNIQHHMIGPIAASQSVLTKKQKELGVMVVDMGAETTSLAVYEEGKLVHVAVIPLGSGHVTRDLAVGMRTSMEVAEKVKVKYGIALESALGTAGKTQIDLAKLNEAEVGVFPISYVADIIEARLKEIFEHVRAELKSIEREGLLPAGVVLVGGGSNIQSIVDLGKRELRLPVKIGVPVGVEGSIADVDNPTYATLVGLLLSGFDDEYEEDSFSDGTGTALDVGASLGGIGGWFKKILSVFLPTD